MPPCYEGAPVFPLHSVSCEAVMSCPIGRTGTAAHWAGREGSWNRCVRRNPVPMECQGKNTFSEGFSVTALSDEGKVQFFSLEHPGT